MYFQDDKFKVSNLVSNAGFRKWLTSPSDKSGKAEVTLQLKKAVRISFIDLGKIYHFNLILFGQFTQENYLFC